MDLTKASPAETPAASLLVPTNAMRFDFGASESKVMTGIFASRAAVMTLLIDSALFGAIAMPFTFFVMRSRTIRACSASSSCAGPVKRHSAPIFAASSLQPFSASA